MKLYEVQILQVDAYGQPKMYTRQAVARSAFRAADLVIALLNRATGPLLSRDDIASVKLLFDDVIVATPRQSKAEPKPVLVMSGAAARPA